MVKSNLINLLQILDNFNKSEAKKIPTPNFNNIPNSSTIFVI